MFKVLCSCWSHTTGGGCCECRQQTGFLDMPISNAAFTEVFPGAAAPPAPRPSPGMHNQKQISFSLCGNASLTTC